MLFGGDSTPITPTPAPSSPASEAKRAWAATKNTTNIATLELFIASYNDSYYAGLARLRIDELKKQAPASPEHGRSAPNEKKCRAMVCPFGSRAQIQRGRRLYVQVPRWFLCRGERLRPLGPTPVRAPSTLMACAPQLSSAQASHNAAVWRVR